MNKDYSDIINLPRFESTKHKRMSIEARSAQFAPFAALTGYEDAIKETARLTDERIEIDDGLKQILNNRLMYAINNNIEVTLTYFVNDEKKLGGKYVEKKGIIKKYDVINHNIILKDNIKIPVDEIINITSNIINFEN